MRRLALLAAVLMLGAPFTPPVHAQTQGDSLGLSAGRSVRTALLERRRLVRSSVVEVRGNTLVLRRDSTGSRVMTIAFSDLSRLDVRNGHRRLTRRGATTGAAVGVLAATLPAAFLPCADGRIGIVYGCIKPVDGLAFVAASAAVGALYGGVIGTVLREPRWRTVVRR